MLSQGAETWLYGQGTIHLYFSQRMTGNNLSVSDYYLESNLSFSHDYHLEMSIDESECHNEHRGRIALYYEGRFGISSIDEFNIYRFLPWWESRVW